MSNYLGFQPTTQPNEYYFISYNSNDIDAVTAICKRLDASGLPMWNDYNIPYGEYWQDQITLRIKNCSAMLVFISKSVFKNESTYLTVEYEMARKYYKIPIIVIVLDTIRPKDVPDSMLSWWIDVERRQCIYVHKHQKPEIVCSQILQAIGWEHPVPPSPRPIDVLIRKIKSVPRRVWIGILASFICLAGIIGIYQLSINIVHQKLDGVTNLYGAFSASDAEGFLSNMSYQYIDYNNHNYEVSVLPYSTYIAGPDSKDTILLSFIDRYGKTFSFYGKCSVVDGNMVVSKGGENLSEQEAAPIIQELTFSVKQAVNGYSISKGSLNKSLISKTSLDNIRKVEGSLSDKEKPYENILSLNFTYDVKRSKTKDCAIFFTDGGSANSPTITSLNPYTNEVEISWDSETHPYNDREVTTSVNKVVAFRITNTSPYGFILCDKKLNYYFYQNPISVISEDSKVVTEKANIPTEVPAVTVTSKPKISSVPTVTVAPEVSEKPTVIATPEVTQTSSIPEIPVTEVPEETKYIKCIGDIEAPAEDFIFPESDSEYLTIEILDKKFADEKKEDLHGLTQQAINEIYARYGYTFKGLTASGKVAQRFFSEKEWYKKCVELCPTNDTSVLLTKYFNEYEKKNFNTIVLWQQQNGVYY